MNRDDAYGIKTRLAYAGITDVGVYASTEPRPVHQIEAADYRVRAFLCGHAIALNDWGDCERLVAEVSAAVADWPEE